MSKLFKFLRIFSLFLHLLLNTCMYFTATDNINVAMYDPTDNDEYLSHRYRYMSMLVSLSFPLSVSILPLRPIIEMMIQFSVVHLLTMITVYRYIVFVDTGVLGSSYKS